MIWTRQNANKVFAEIKKTLQLDFAETEGYCCRSCTWYSLEKKYGADSKGLWLQYYKNGMNKGLFKNSGYIAYNLNQIQANTAFEILKKYFNVEWNGEITSCFHIVNFLEV